MVDIKQLGEEIAEGMAAAMRDGDPKEWDDRQSEHQARLAAEHEDPTLPPAPALNADGSLRRGYDRLYTEVRERLFNPYHDERGRFTGKTGGGYMAVRGGTFYETDEGDMWGGRPITRGREKQQANVRRAVKGALAKLKARGVDVGEVNINYTSWGPKGPVASGAVGSGGPGKVGRIRINMANPCWGNPKKYEAAQARAKIWSSDAGTAAIIHEVGHTLHRASHRVIRARVDMAVASKVSSYACSSQGEFVAETFAGLVAGKRYPNEVLGLYRQLGGPPVGGRR
jgi:hypothetical protein